MHARKAIASIRYKNANLVPLWMRLVLLEGLQPTVAGLSIAQVPRKSEYRDHSIMKKL